MARQSNRDLASIDAISPERLSLMLETSGWRLVGKRTGVYRRYAPPGDGSERDSNLIVPLNVGAPDFAFQMHAAHTTLINNDKALWSKVFNTVTNTTADQFKFSKETAAPSGFIQWSQGERMFGQAKSTLVAGAKSHVERAPYYANRLSQFAKRFLDSTLMGQTEPGSYIVNAFVPIDEHIQLQNLRSEGFEIAGLSAARTRDITQSIVGALDATSDALKHYYARNSFSAFDESVENGISYELLHSLAGLAEDSDGAEVSVQLGADGPVPVPPAIAFEYRPTDTPILRLAADRLLEDFPSRQITIVGRVHLLKKDIDEPGSLGIEWTSLVGKRRMRVRLAENSDYPIAAQAHIEGRPVQLTGMLVRLGRRQFLLDAARLDTVIDAEPDPTSDTDLSEDLLF